MSNVNAPQQYQKFLEKNTEYGFLTPELLAFLENPTQAADPAQARALPFSLSPATGKAELHNSFDGGLVDHILRVASYAHRINDAVLQGDMKVDRVSLLRVCFLHAIGKAGCFVRETRQWFLQRGMCYDFNNDLPSMRVGERSLYYYYTHSGAAMVPLSPEEFQAILAVDKPEDDSQMRWYTHRLTDVLRSAVQLAIKEEKERYQRANPVRL